MRLSFVSLFLLVVVEVTLARLAAKLALANSCVAVILPDEQPETNPRNMTQIGGVQPWFLGVTLQLILGDYPSCLLSFINNYTASKTVPLPKVTDELPPTSAAAPGRASVSHRLLCFMGI